MNECRQDNHLVTMKDTQMDAIKDDCFVTMKECCNDDHLVTTMPDQMDVSKNEL